MRTRPRRREDRKEEMLLLQVSQTVSRDAHVRLAVQSHDDAQLQPDRELHVSTAAQLQREGRSERGDLLQPLPLPRPVDVPVRGEEKELDIHRETVCPREAAKEVIRRGYYAVFYEEKLKVTLCHRNGRELTDSKGSCLIL